MAKQNQLKKMAGTTGRRLVDRLPPETKLRVRQVKRAALGQSPVAPKGKATAGVKATPVGLPSKARLTNPVPSIPGVTRLEVRRQNIFADRDRSVTALEIGPAHNAILPKREGFDARTVDYLDRAGLVDKYKGFPQYSPDDIEEVDYVLAPGAAMADVIPDRFDIVLASHVIEHTTSLIDFVNECGKLLRPGGTLALVVPDHRYCLDRFRERTSIATVIDASVDQKPVHTVGTITDFALNAVRRAPGTSWAPGHSSNYSFAHDMDLVRAKAASATSGKYVDVHRWIFSPNHLRLMLNDLANLGYISLRESHFGDTVGHEFFLNLTAESTGSGLSRAELVSRAAEELRTMDAPEWNVDPGQ